MRPRAFHGSRRVKAAGTLFLTWLGGDSGAILLGATLGGVLAGVELLAGGVPVLVAGGDPPIDVSPAAGVGKVGVAGEVLAVS